MDSRLIKKMSEASHASMSNQSLNFSFDTFELKKIIDSNANFETVFDVARDETFEMHGFV